MLSRFGRVSASVTGRFRMPNPYPCLYPGFPGTFPIGIDPGGHVVLSYLATVLDGSLPEIPGGTHGVASGGAEGVDCTARVSAAAPTGEPPPDSGSQGV